MAMLVYRRVYLNMKHHAPWLPAIPDEAFFSNKKTPDFSCDFFYATNDLWSVTHAQLVSLCGLTNLAEGWLKAPRSGELSLHSRRKIPQILNHLWGRSVTSPRMLAAWCSWISEFMAPKTMIRWSFYPIKARYCWWLKSQTTTREVWNPEKIMA